MHEGISQCNGASWTRPGAPVLHVNALWGSTRRPMWDSCAALSQRLSVSTKRSGNHLTHISASHPIQVTCRHGDQQWWLAKWADKWGNDEKQGACLVLSPAASALPSPAVSVVVCSVFLIRPVSDDTEHTVLKPYTAHSPPASQLLSV